MAVVFNVPWYATGFRGDQFEEALKEIAPIALRYGAIDWSVYRYVDDRYKLQQLASFESPAQYSLYWNGPEFQAFRADYSGWYQVPVLYYPMVLAASGRHGGNGNGAAVPGAAAHAD